ncbi:PRC-barrel domain-containing protein [Rhodococcus antarcticus]|jgi:sporulation protein YlmC with PRC-barrel domain|uniref:PRC-barrel domain-containing protein n=1 Tax=Rhodococcus antarcticus TaxID=2987751 RepID=A0ABY6P0H4_9NOCA|nr:PRC-barrel domain-containing protein [Rhodococcus antarcticus]UZJ25164.1 PRC-barrel domain-containing protein [Rhodococcus antarcticus]
MTGNGDNASLHTLGDRGKTVDVPENDVRDRTVKDKDGKGIGTVADLLVDDREGKVRFLQVEHGGFLGFGETTTLIPVDAVTKITTSDVFVDQSRDRVAGAPGYDPDLVDDRPYHSSIYGYYGYPPYWGAGYIYPQGLWGMQPGRPPTP